MTIATGIAAAGLSSVTIGSAWAATGADTPSQDRTADTKETRNRTVEIMIGLKRPGAALERFVATVSDPHSPSYGRYLPIEQVARRFGASRHDRQTVLSYLRRRGAPAAVDATGSFASARLSMTAARTIGIRPGRSSLPKPLRNGAVSLSAQLVDRQSRPTDAGISGSSPAPSAPKPTPPSGTPSGCPQALAGGGFTPNQLRTAYGIDHLVTQGYAGQGQAVALLEVDGFKPATANTFASCFGLGKPTIDVFRVGIRHKLAPGMETPLDIEVLMAIAPRLSKINVYQGRAVTRSGKIVLYESLPKMISAALKPPPASGPRPTVISASLSLCERSWRRHDMEMVKLTERVLQAAAAAGVTFVSSAGDAGSSDCVPQTGRSRKLRFPAVGYPASSPYATGVGGSHLELDASNDIASETVWNNTTRLAFGPSASDLTVKAGGGGGTSVIFSPAPSYQRSTLPRAAARSVPDVSFAADTSPGYAYNFCSLSAKQCASLPYGGWQTTGGTSAATPLMAAGVALVNQARAQAGQPALGFLNPLLYQRAAPGPPGLFRDIVKTGNDLYDVGCCTAGIGYDSASGFGSMDFSQLLP